MEKLSWLLNVMSDVESLDVMLGNYPRNENEIPQTDKEIEVD